MLDIPKENDINEEGYEDFGKDDLSQLSNELREYEERKRELESELEAETDPKEKMQLKGELNKIESEYRSLSIKCKEIAEDMAFILDEEDVEDYGFGDKLLETLEDHSWKFFVAATGSFGTAAGFFTADLFGSISAGNDIGIPLDIIGAGSLACGTAGSLHGRKEYDGRHFSSIKARRVYEGIIENPEEYTDLF